MDPNQPPTAKIFSLQNPIAFTPDDDATNATAFLPACPPSEVFGTELHFEHILMHDQQALDYLSNTIGLPAGTITQQVTVNPATRLRADLVAFPTSLDAAPTVLELTLKPLDHAHVTRGITYASELAAHDVIFIAPKITPAAEQEASHLASLFRASKRNLTIHFVRLITYQHQDDKSFSYTLERLAPPRPAIDPNRVILAALQSAVTARGDDSLANLSIEHNRVRIEASKGFNNAAGIRIEVTKEDVTMTIRAKNHALKARLVNGDLIDRIKNALPTDILTYFRPADADASTIATVAFPVPTVTNGQPEPIAIQALAKAFIQIRAIAVDAYGIQPSSLEARTIRFRKPN